MYGGTYGGTVRTEVEQFNLENGACKWRYAVALCRGYKRVQEVTVRRKPINYRMRSNGDQIEWDSLVHFSIFEGSYPKSYDPFSRC